jgi:hypothetical protein
MVLPRHLQTDPSLFLKVIAPYRQDRVVAVEYLFTGYWLADLCAQKGIPLVLSQTLTGKPSTGTRPRMTRLTPTRSPSCCMVECALKPMSIPAEMRPTRDLFRRRMHWMRKRAELLTPIQNRD